MLVWGPVVWIPRIATHRYPEKNPKPFNLPLADDGVGKQNKSILDYLGSIAGATDETIVLGKMS